MEYSVTRVCGDGWFVDVPTGYEWAGERGTSMEVITSMEEARTSCHPVERLELLGRVLVRGDANTIVSCGGLLASLPSSTIGDEDELCVVFTREGADADA